MKKLITSISLAVVATGFAASASAAVWGPSGPFTLEDSALSNTDLGSERMQISKGLDLRCHLTGGGTIDGDSASVTSLALSPLPCDLVQFTAFPYNIEAVSETEVSLQNVTVTGITGNCFGNLDGTIDQATGKITFVEATLPDSDDPVNNPPCVVTGTVNMAQPVSYTVEEEPTTP